MRDSVANGALSVEDKRLDRLPESAKGGVKKVDHPLDAAKVLVGKAVRSAIGDEVVRVYGDEGLLSRVMSGEKVPDYMARIVKNDDARRRYALSLLRGDKRVKVKTIIEIEEEAS